MEKQDITAEMTGHIILAVAATALAVIGMIINNGGAL